MNNDLLLTRIHRLQELIHQTQPEVMNYEVSDNWLFQQDEIEVEEMIEEIKQNRIQSVVEMMKQANRIYNFRIRVQSGEIDMNERTIELIKLDEEIKDLIIQNQKIGAIKHYRYHMKKLFNMEKTLKESKQYIDSIQQKYDI